MSTTPRVAAISLLAAAAAIAAAPGMIAVEPPIVVSSAPDYQSPIGSIIAVAEAKGIDPEHLLAISAQESALGRIKVGDNGCSRGWFHINLCANPAAGSVIGDPAREAGWVADRLISYGYLEGHVALALARYNSPAAPNYAYAELVEKRRQNLDSYLAPYQMP